MITLKRVRISLTIAVLIVGGLLVVSGPISADTSETPTITQDRRIRTVPCRSQDTTVFCYFAYCLEPGRECSFYQGACFSAWGGYCDEGGGGDGDKKGGEDSEMQ